MDDTNSACSQPVTRKPEGEDPRDLLGELCAFAPNFEIRDCLRLFDTGKSDVQLRTSINRKNKSTITNSLEYLGVILEWNDYMKPTCVNKLIYRLQNLLPKLCPHCSTSYNVDKGDEPLLPCKRCGQEAHRSILRSLGIDKEKMTEDDIRKLINPFGLPCTLSVYGMCMPFRSRAVIH